MPKNEEKVEQSIVLRVTLFAGHTKAHFLWSKNRQYGGLKMGRRGESIFRRKDGRLEARYPLEKDATTGKRKYRSVYAGTYTEAKEKRAQAMQTAYISRSCGYFAEAVKMWLEEKEPDIKEQTYRRYRQCIDTHITPYFGQLRCSAITQSVVDAFLKQKRISGRLDGKGGLSRSTLRGMCILLQSVLLFSYQRNLGIPELIRIKKPKIEKKSIHVLQKSEQKKMETVLLGAPNGTNLAIYLALHSGVRIGELCALRWSDIDFDERQLFVRSTVIRNKSGQSAIAPPKSETSHRAIPLTLQLTKLLAAERENSCSEFVFSSPRKNAFLNPRTLQYRFRALLSQLEIPEISFHALRHTFATRWIECGMDVKSLSEVLGHAGVQITLDIYVHSSDKLKREAIEKLESFSGQIYGQKSAESLV